MSLTDEMDLEIQTPLTTPGPTWATKINNNFTIIDGHNHTSGKGASLSQAAVVISGNYEFNSYRIVDAGGIQFTNLSAAPSTSADANGVFAVNGDLYWVNASGVPVQITSGTGINIASVGTIGGDYGQVGVTASAVYSNTTKTFSWTQSSGVAAKMATGSVIVYHESAGVQGVTIAAKSTTAQYTLSFPTVAPNTTNMFRVYDTAGDSIFKTLTTDGTLNITPSASNLSFSLPQSIATNATVTFGTLNLTTLNSTNITLSGGILDTRYAIFTTQSSAPTTPGSNKILNYYHTTENQMFIRYPDGTEAILPKDRVQSGIAAGNSTLNARDYNTFIKTGSSSATTITLSNMYDGQTITVLISTVASQGFITWAGGTFRWPNGLVPTPTTSASRADRYVFQKIGGYIYGSADMNTY